MKDWTEDEVRILKKLWNLGLTALQISEKLPGRSRSSVTANARRHGLASRKKKTAPRQQTDPSEAKAKNAAKALRKFHDLMRETNRSKDGLTLFELLDHSCRFPLNTPDKGEEFIFCGKRKRIGSSYCQAHHDVAHVQPALRIRRVAA